MFELRPIEKKELIERGLRNIAFQGEGTARTKYWARTGLQGWSRVKTYVKEGAE